MLCRVCLKESDFPINIFGENSFEIVVALQKHFFGVFEVLPQDIISTIICSDCWYKVKEFHQYYIAIEEAQKTLKEALASDENKIIEESNKNELVFQHYDTEVKIKEELVENVWQAEHNSPTGVEENIESNPLYEVENIVLPTEVVTPADNVVVVVVNNDYTHDHELEATIESDDYSDTCSESAIKVKFGQPLGKEENEENVEGEQKINSKFKKCIDRHDPSTTQIQLKSKKSKRCKSNAANDEAIIKKHIPMNCPMCATNFENFAEIRLHFRDKHDELKPFVTCCGRRLVKRFLIVQHAYRHENPEFFKCKECQKVFADSYTLRNHMHANHAPEEELKYNCEQCDKRFSRRYLLELHKPSHIPVNERKFGCDKCPQSKPFASEHLLSIHVNMRHKKATNVCHVCAKEIRDNQAFEKHVRLHFEDSGPRVKCPRPNCDRWLKDEDNLKQHLRRHNDEGKIFTCDECGKMCKNRRALHSHFKYAHTNEVFTCDECNKTFKKAITLKEHMAQHTGESLYKCPFCTRTFNSNANMHSHKKKMHPVEWDIWRKTKTGSSQKIISKLVKTADNLPHDNLHYDNAI